MNNNMWILAQEEPIGITGEPVGEQETTTMTTADGNAPAAGKAPPKSPLVTFLPFILIFVVFYFLLFRGPRKKQQKHKQMVQTLERNDRIQTIGGILGTVVDINDNEITLKIDESNNTKIKILASAVGKNMSKEKS